MNFSAINMILKTYKRITDEINCFDEKILTDYNKILLNSFVFLNCHKLKKIMGRIELIYTGKFFRFSSRIKRTSELKMIAN